MTQQLDIFSLTVPDGFTPSPPPPKRGGCGRDLNAGPGSCKQWWEGCPARATNCYQRWLQANYKQVEHLPIPEQNEIARNAIRYGWQR